MVPRLPLCQCLLLVFDAVLPSFFSPTSPFLFLYHVFHGLTDFGCYIHYLVLFSYSLSSCMIYHNDIKDPLRLHFNYGFTDMDGAQQKHTFLWLL